jgi:hypothetical protein
MSKTTLAKIFAPAGPGTRAATVTARLSRGLYQLTDERGRPIQAESTALYAPGARVLVAGGRIVGTTGRASAGKTFYV